MTTNSEASRSRVWSHYAAGNGQYYSLNEELNKDYMFLGTKGFLNPYYIGTFLNGYEHDVGNTKAAYQEREGCNNPAHYRYHGEYLLYAVLKQSHSVY